MLDETRAELGWYFSYHSRISFETDGYCPDDFQASSKELEDELERELSATETQQAELKDRIKRLEAEKDDWKVCMPQRN